MAKMESGEMKNQSKITNNLSNILSPHSIDLKSLSYSKHFQSGIKNATFEKRQVSEKIIEVATEQGVQEKFKDLSVSSLSDTEEKYSDHQSLGNNRQSFMKKKMTMRNNAE